MAIHHPEPHLQRERAAGVPVGAAPLRSLSPVRTHSTACPLCHDCVYRRSTQSKPAAGAINKAGGNSAPSDAQNMDSLARVCCAHENTHTLYVCRFCAHCRTINYEIFTISAHTLMQFGLIRRQCDVTQRTTLPCNAKSSPRNTEHSRPYEKHRQFEKFKKKKSQK